MRLGTALVALALAAPTGVEAQQAVSPQTIAVTLPTNTEVLVTLNDALDSRRVRKGQQFDVSVSRDVMIGDAIAIPRGTPGRGEIVYRTNKGPYGKSGKFELVLRSLTVAGQPLPVTGRFREEGRGNTGAVIGTIILAGLVGGAFVTGHSAVLPQGRELKAFTAEAYQATALRPRFYAARPILAPVAPVTVAGTIGTAASDYTPPAPDAYQRALAAQRGVRGGNPVQGWTISD